MISKCWALLMVGDSSWDWESEDDFSLGLGDVLWSWESTSKNSVGSVGSSSGWEAEGTSSPVVLGVIWGLRPEDGVSSREGGSPWDWRLEYEKFAGFELGWRWGLRVRVSSLTGVSEYGVPTWDQSSSASCLVSTWLKGSSIMADRLVQAKGSSQSVLSSHWQEITMASFKLYTKNGGEELPVLKQITRH